MKSSSLTVRFDRCELLTTKIPSSYSEALPKVNRFLQSSLLFSLFFFFFLCSWTENLALGKPVAQSSTYRDVHASGEAEKAVDGIADANFNNGHCSQTYPNNPGWWRVDLGPNGVPVSEVSIVNRFSSNPDVRLRSKDYKITLGESYFHLHWTLFL